MLQVIGKICDVSTCKHASCIETGACGGHESAKHPRLRHVANVAEVHMSRYTIEWTNGSLPEGTELFAYTPSSAPRLEGQLDRSLNGGLARIARSLAERGVNTNVSLEELLRTAANILSEDGTILNNRRKTNEPL